MQELVPFCVELPDRLPGCVAIAHRRGRRHQECRQRGLAVIPVREHTSGALHCPRLPSTQFDKRNTPSDKLRAGNFVRMRSTDVFGRAESTPRACDQQLQSITFGIGPTEIHVAVRRVRTDRRVIFGGCGVSAFGTAGPFTGFAIAPREHQSSGPLRQRRHSLRMGTIALKVRGAAREIRRVVTQSSLTAGSICVG